MKPRLQGPNLQVSTTPNLSGQPLRILGYPDIIRSKKSSEGFTTSELDRGLANRVQLTGPTGWWGLQKKE